MDGILDGLLALAAKCRAGAGRREHHADDGPLTLDVTATGGVRPRRVMTRGGARPGDEVYMTGVLASAATGLAVLKAGRRHREQVAFASSVICGRNRASGSDAARPEPGGIELYRPERRIG